MRDLPAPTVAFPPSITDPVAHRWWRRGPAVAALVVLAVVVAGGAIVATRAGASPAARYRVATAGRHDVTQVLTNVATVEPMSQARMAFPAAGTVATVQVAVGDTVAAGQTLATTDASALDDTLAEKQAALAKAQLRLTAAQNGEALSSGASGTDASSGSGSSGSGSSPSTSTPSPSAGTATAAELLSFEQAVQTAAAEVAVAEQALGQATLASPIAGTVVAVDLGVGEDVTAASTTAGVVVAGDGGLEATTTVGIDDVADVAVGQTAAVVPDGRDTPLAGRVRSVAVSPDTADGTATYRVVIAFDEPVTDLGNGSTATATIVLASATDVLAVPTSAVSALGDLHTVTVLDGDTATTTRVQTGVVGATWTEITSGLREGQTVVLADLTEPLPGSATDATRQNRRDVFGPGGGAAGNAPPMVFSGGPPPGAR